MSAHTELNTMQKVRFDITMHLINTGRYDQLDTKNLINNATEIVKYIDRGEAYGCDGSDNMKQRASGSGVKAINDVALPKIQLEIIGEIAETLGMLGANGGLLACIGSWGDTLPQDEILEMWRDWNRLAKQEGWIVKPAILV